MPSLAPWTVIRLRLATGLVLLADLVEDVAALPARLREQGRGYSPR